MIYHNCCSFYSGVSSSIDMTITSNGYGTTAL